MRIAIISASLFMVFSATPAWSQYGEPMDTQNSSVQRYANMPEEAVPFRKFTKPYKEWFIDATTIEYNGAARERVLPGVLGSESVNIGFLGPIENNYESPYGLAMLHGAQMAIEEANARGGFRLD